MAVEDYIRRRGDLTNTAPYQGIGGGLSGDGDAPIMVNVSSGGGALEVVTGGTIDDALWQAQTAIIIGESAYLDQVNKEWIEVKDNLDGGTWRTKFQIIGEFLEEGIGAGVVWLLAKANIVLSGGPASVVGVLASLVASWGLGKLEEVFAEWLDKGNALLVAMKAENTAMLAVEQNGQNYEHRNDVINRHERMIARLLDELDQTRQSAEGMLMTTGGRATTIDEEEDGWDTVLSSLGTSIEQLDEWVDSVETANDANQPVPSAPSLPSLPSDPKKAVSRKVAFLLARYGFKLATELIRKQRETDTHVSDLVGKMDELKGALENMDSSLITGLGDLRWNDEVLYLPGNVRIHLKNRMIQYGN